MFEDFSVKYSFAQMSQYVHLLAYSSAGMPSDYWMPTNKNVKPEKSMQHTFGLSQLLNNKYEISFETYYKTLDNLITFIPGKSFLGNLDSWENIVEKEGTGINYGVELFVQKTKGNTTGWVSGTISKAERTFENLNGGKAYPFKYDRLLDFSFVINHKFSENISLSATWTYGSGYPITLATQYYNANGKDIFIYGEKNSFRMSDYHRLDVAANFHKKTKWGKRTWTVSIFNLYNRNNPYYYYYRYSNQELPTPAGEIKIYQRNLFGFFPSVAYSFKF